MCACTVDFDFREFPEIFRLSIESGPLLAFSNKVNTVNTVTVMKSLQACVIRAWSGSEVDAVSSRALRRQKWQTDGGASAVNVFDG